MGQTCQSNGCSLLRIRLLRGLYRAFRVLVIVLVVVAFSFFVEIHVESFVGSAILWRPDLKFYAQVLSCNILTEVAVDFARFLVIEVRVVEDFVNDEIAKHGSQGATFNGRPVRNIDLNGLGGHANLPKKGIDAVYSQVCSRNVLHFVGEDIQSDQSGEMVGPVGLAQVFTACEWRRLAEVDAVHVALEDLRVLIV